MLCGVLSSSVVVVVLCGVVVVDLCGVVVCGVVVLPSSSKASIQGSSSVFWLPSLPSSSSSSSSSWQITSLRGTNVSPLSVEGRGH